MSIKSSKGQSGTYPSKRPSKQVLQVVPLERGLDCQRVAAAACGNATCCWFSAISPSYAVVQWAACALAAPCGSSKYPMWCVLLLYPVLATHFFLLVAQQAPRYGDEGTPRFFFFGTSPRFFLAFFHPFFFHPPAPSTAL